MQSSVQKDIIKNSALSHFTLENLYEAVFWINAEGMIMHVNKMATLMTGRSAAELTSMKVPELNPLIKDFDAFWKKLKKARKLNFESLHRHKDGHVYEVEITGNYIEFEGQEFSCSIVRYKSEEKKEIELYKYTLQNLHEDIYWIDDKAFIIQVNESACRTTGYTKEELLGKTIFDLNPTENVKTWDKHWQQVKKEKTVTLQTVHKHKDGYLYEVEITNNYIEFGGKEYACSVLKDIRKKKLEEDILKFISEATAGLTGTDYFHGLVKNVTSALGVRYALITECVNDEKTKVRTLSYVDRQQLKENVEYELEGTPCEIVMKGKDYFCANELEKQFPKEKGIQSYVAVPIYSPATGEVLGHIAGLDAMPMTNDQNQTSILKILLPGLVQKWTGWMH